MSSLQKGQSFFEKNQGTQVLLNQHIPIPQTMQNDPRYFYLRIIDCYDINQSLLPTHKQNKVQTMKLTFEMSTKTSHTHFQIKEKRLTAHDTDKIRNETHLFCYEAEQILKVQLSRHTPRHQKREKKKEKGKKEQNLPQCGFSRVVLTPFAVMPYTRHKVKIRLIKLKSDKQVENTTAAILEVQIFYFLNFKAKIEITPSHGNFISNRAALGTMRACCIFTINSQRKKSIIAQEGGIHPNWQKQALKLLKSEQQDQRYTPQTKSNRLSFNLDSVGHTLKIQVVNFPFLDKDAQLVGSRQIRIQSHDFLRVPNEDITHHQIRVYYYDPYQKQTMLAGTIILKTKFIFDVKSLRMEVDSQEQSG